MTVSLGAWGPWWESAEGACGLGCLLAWVLAGMCGGTGGLAIAEREEGSLGAWENR